MLALEKLSVYTGGTATIEARDVEAAIGKTKEDTVFELTAALVERKAAAGAYYPEGSSGAGRSSLSHHENAHPGDTPASLRPAAVKVRETYVLQTRYGL